MFPGWTVRGPTLRAGHGASWDGSLPWGQPYLCPVWQEDGAGQVTSDPTQQVDDGYAMPAGQLL